MGGGEQAGNYIDLAALARWLVADVRKRLRLCLPGTSGADMAP